MKNANQALMGLAVVGLLGGSVAITTAAPADTGVELPAPSATDGESSVVTDPTTTLPETTTTSGPDTTSTSTTSTSTTSTSLPATTTSVPGSTTTVPDSTTTSTPDTTTTTTEPSALLTLGDRVWIDANGNGVQEFGEAGISGVTISATYAGIDGAFGTGDDQTFTTQTGANGKYQFTDLAPGTYRVVVGAGIPGGLINSSDPDTGTASPDGRSELTLTTSTNSQDFGYKPTVVAGTSSIGDTVYADTNGNGQQDAGEPGISGVVVTLTSAAGPQTDTTDGNGNYLFGDLDAGNYTVTVDTSTLPSGVVNTDDEDGNNNDTTSVVLGDDDAHLTADFGYDEPAAPLGSIGDTIFDDVNGNGTQDAGDPGISGVTVTLTGAGPDGVFGTADDTTASVDTDGNGNYTFDNLPAGDFVVTVDTGDLPAGVVNTFDEDGNNDSTTPVLLAPGEDTDTVDFGYTTPAAPLGSIGDTVYLDRNGNGAQDAGEPGLPGATVVLFGPGPDGALGTADDTNQVTTTGDNGEYLFIDLPAGSYQVTVGGAVVDNLDNTGDPDGGADSTSLVDLAAGDDDLDQDFGYDVENAVLGDRVWWDLNADGSQDTGEPGFNGVTVTATFAGDDGQLGTADDIVSTTTTSGDGDYLFTDIPEGDYLVRVTGGLPGGVVNTFDADDGINNPDGQSTLTLDDSNLGQDFGYVGTGSIGDTVFLDSNGNGTPDAGEGLGGVGVSVLYAGPDGVFGTADDIIFPTTTDNNGNYSVDGLPAGEYVVAVDTAGLPTGVEASVDPDGGDDSTSAVTLAPGETNNEQDFGYALLGSIGDTVYLDENGFLNDNGNGVQDPGDEGIPGVTVTLTGPGPDGIDGTDDDVDETTTTDENGEYLFEDLPAGDYTVTVVGGLPDGANNTGDPDGAAVGTGDSTSDVTLAPGEDNLDQDFGYEPEGSILGDRVWLDLNADGVQDPNEPGINGVTVEATFAGGDGILDTADDQTLLAVTVGDGDYLFDDLNDGLYRVAVLGFVPNGLVLTFDADSGIINPDGMSQVDLDGVDLEQDFGYVGTGSIGDSIFLDANGNGTPDPGEGIPGVDVTVTSLGPDGVLGTDDDIVFETTTDDHGNYSVDGLPPGDYVVAVDTADLPDGVVPSVDPDGGDDSMSAVTLAPGETNDDQDFGYTGTGSIGDTIYLDTDGDGTQGDPAAEPGIGGVTVTLTEPGPDGVLGTDDDTTQTATTDENGNYLFDDLPAGDYTVTVVGGLPDGAANTGDPDGAAGGTGDSTSTVTLGAGEDNGDQDFGYQPVGSVLGDRVWLDLNADGVQDDGEPGINGVTVQATFAGPDGQLGTADDVAETTTTGGDGDYLFDELVDGLYQVEILAGVPDGLAPTFDADSGIVNPDEMSETELVTADLEQDFGYVGTGSIGDSIFLDANGNGTSDDGEGIPNVDVTVTYLGPDGVLGTDDDIVFETTTDTDGNYTVPGLPAGDYVVTVDADDLPDGLQQTTDPDGGNDSTSSLTLAPGEDNDEQDFGYAGLGSIGDTIYLDANGNGTQDDPTDEPGIDGVTVTLTGPGPDGIGGTDDDVAATTTTDENGNYLFENLPAGDYTVTVEGGLPDNVDNTGDPDGAAVGDGDSTSAVTLGAGDDNLDQDFGYDADSALLGDRVWLDLNADGVQDPDEPGIEGVEVTATYAPGGIFGMGGEEVFTTTTDENGNYLFTDLPNGEYTVEITGGLPAGLAPTFDADSGTTNPDETSATTLDVIDLDQDFGYVPLGSIGDTVYLDVDGNGTQDDPADEPGIPGVTVTLTEPGPDGVLGTDDDTTKMTTTDADGEYLFVDLLPGDYTITVSGSIVDAFDNTGDPDGAAVGAGDSTSNVTLGAGEDNVDQDFGYQATSALGDRVWYDQNRDGVQDAGEPGINGVAVQATWAGIDGIFGTADDVIDIDATENDGFYLFQDIADGLYIVEVLDGVPADDAPTYDADSGITNPDEMSELNLVTIDLDQDFGYVADGAIGDTIYLDANNNGVQETGEHGIEGVDVTVEYVDPASPLGASLAVTVTTDENGNYLADGLPAGDFTVTVDTTDLPAGVVITDDPDGAAVGVGDSISAVTLAPNEVNLDQDFGYVPTASIGDSIYLDLNGDGDQDLGEPGIPGQTVTLTGPGPDGLAGTADDVDETTTTDENGNYLFEGLPDGDYHVTVVGGITADAENTGDPDGGTPNESNVTLVDGTSDLEQDFGYGGEDPIDGINAIGDTIWLDSNSNGVQDADEAGIEGVEVTVTWAGLDGTLGTGDDVVLPATVTDGNGNYLVAFLPDGTYSVEVTGGVPAGLVQTGDPDGVLDATSTVTVAGGQTNFDQDFGYAGTGSIGDTIYLDSNGNGVQDAGELGVGGVTVVLTGAGPDGVLGTSDDTEQTATTDGDGIYLFDGLPADTYQVDVTGGLPDGATNSGDPDGVPGQDGDSSSIVVLAAGEDNLDQDFGYEVDSVLGDRVWLDRNGDGVQDDDEPGINGVGVTVFSPGVDGGFGTADDVEEGSTITSGNGDYLFTDLPDGPYQVVVGGNALTGLTQTFDSDGTLDNTSETVLIGADLDQDFGFQGNSSLAGTVWLDSNADGVIDPDEALLAGVDLTVLWFGPDGILGTADDVTFPVTTDENGHYDVQGLPAGVYAIQLDLDSLPEGLDVTYDSVGGLADPSNTTVVVLGDNEALENVDFGTLGMGSIGDTIFFDQDGDGVQDAGEPGLAGVDVDVTWAGSDGVFGTADDEVFAASTDENGVYLVDGLPAGDFVVQVDADTLPEGMTNTVDSDGNNDGQSPVTLAPGEENLDQDFGYTGDGAIGDTVYLDLNGNGVQDPDEPGIADQPVTLTWAGPDGDVGSDDDVVFDTATDENGNYLFEGLPDGAYVVTVIGGVADDYANTGDPDGGTPNESNVTIANGADDLDQDFGYEGPNALSGTIVEDVNGNGVQDPGEPGVEGVDVVVTWAGPDGVFGTDDDVEFPPVTSDDNGEYSVDGLPDGLFTVEVVEDTVPEDAAITFDPDGTENPDGTTQVELTGGETVTGVDFGYTAGTGSIGDNVWLDLDGDGIRDLGEPGLIGATVTLTYLGPDGIAGTDDDVLYVTTVDGAGNYLFENLPAGDFIVTISNLPAGVAPTADPDGGSDLTSSVTLAPGESNLDQDFGFAGSAAVGDTIFIDTNGNGIRDGLEPGVAGIPVTIITAGPDGILGTADDIVVMTVTDASGMYFVDGLPAGPTLVSYDPASLPNGFLPSSDLDGGSGNAAATTTIELAPGEINRDVDFAIGGDGEINGTVFEDTNDNGVQDPGEPGLPGAVVIVTQNGPDGSVTIPVITGPDGTYVADNLPPGDYGVTLDPATLPPDVNADIQPTTVTIVPGGVVTVDFPVAPTSVLPASPTPTPTTTPTNPITPLPGTGSDTIGLLLAAAVMLMLGVALLATRRRGGAAARPASGAAGWPAPGA